MESGMVTGRRVTRSACLAMLGLLVTALAHAHGDVPAAPEAGGPRNFVVKKVAHPEPMRASASAVGRVVKRYPAGTVFDNLGCEHGKGGTWCDVQPLGGGPRGYVALAALKPAVGPDGRVATGPDDSALRAGEGRFDATGKLPCATAAGQPMSMQCDSGVARAGGGYATLVVTRPDGRKRAIFFRMGRAIGADTSQAEGSQPFRATREGDLNLVRVGDERYEIPDAAILGG